MIFDRFVDVIAVDNDDDDDDDDERFDTEDIS
jgi:hypothetical protein